MIGLVWWHDAVQLVPRATVGVGQDDGYVMVMVGDHERAHARAMTATQAREIAAYLVELADSIDGGEDVQ